MGSSFSPLQQTVTVLMQLTSVLSSFLDLGDLDHQLDVICNPSSGDDVEEDDLSDGDLNEEAESVVLYSQYFAIKGAAW